MRRTASSGIDLLFDILSISHLKRHMYEANIYSSKIVETSVNTNSSFYDGQHLRTNMFEFELISDTTQSTYLRLLCCFIRIWCSFHFILYNCFWVFVGSLYAGTVSHCETVEKGQLTIEIINHLGHLGISSIYNLYATDSASERLSSPYY